MTEQSSEQKIKAFIEVHSAYVRSIAAKLAPNPSMADDIAQQAFVVALNKIKDFMPDREVKPWIAGIVRNLSRKAWTEVIKQGRLKKDVLAEHIGSLAKECSDDLFEEKDKLRECLERVPEKSRKLLNMRYNLEMTSDKIAERVASTAEAVRMALVRIRTKLQLCMESN